MIKGINTAGRYIDITGGTPSTYVARSYNSPSHNQGQMMYDLDNQCMKVFDGQNWIVLAGGYATVDLSYEAQSLLDWAREKRAEERELVNRLEKNPGLRDAYEKFKIMDVLTKENK